jgi:hypothetical protein
MLVRTHGLGGRYMHKSSMFPNIKRTLSVAFEFIMGFSESSSPSRMEQPSDVAHSIVTRLDFVEPMALYPLVRHTLSIYV